MTARCPIFARFLTLACPSDLPQNNRIMASPLPRLGRLVAASALVASLAPLPALARGTKIIRDAEIEALLRDYAGPIFNAAGLGSRGADIVVVQSPAFNAFVASGSRMFINSGTLLEAKTPNEVIGVIAHETGHLAGGHLSQLRSAAARAKALGAAAAIIGAAGAVAGSQLGSGSSAGTAGKAGVVGTTMGATVAERSLLSYRRAQELHADRAALNYLNATGQSARGMVDTFRRFADQQLLAARYADPYALSHPMPRDRIAQLETVAKKSRHWDSRDRADLQRRHDLMRAKLAAFIEHPSRVERRFPRSDTSLAAAYARAIVAYRHGNPRKALRQIDALIKAAPSYAYFHELKGQALLEAGRAKDAIGPLSQAARLAPNEGLIRILLGHALLETGDRNRLSEAIRQLSAGLADEPLAAVGYRHLATAYARLGREPEAQLATAQGMLIQGDVSAAKAYAKRAQANLKHGSPPWLQAEDILTYAPPSWRG